MKRVFLFFILATLSGISGCRQHQSHPEAMDPVYLDMNLRAEKLIMKIADAQKDVDKDRDALENAPIRTGQRQDARDDYFDAQKKLEKLIETYRFQALRLETQLKRDRTSYETAYKSNKPWPDPQAVEDYKIEMKAAETPKDWDPDSKIKKRAPAEEKPAESESSEAGE